MHNLYSVDKIYIALTLLCCRGLCACFSVKFGANDLNYVDVPLNPTHSLSTVTSTFSHLVIAILCALVLVLCGR